MAKTIFATVATALKKELEPQGFDVHVRTNHGEIKVTDVTAGLTWTVQITHGPELSEA